MTLAIRFRAISPGRVVVVVNYDLGALEDVPAWCRMRGHAFLGHATVDGVNRFYIRRGP